MSVQLNHTIVSCRDQQRSAAFLSGILGLPPPTRFGPFLVVAADNDVSLDFAERSGPIGAQHYAFLVGDEEFDAAFGRIRDQGLFLVAALSARWDWYLAQEPRGKVVRCELKAELPDPTEAAGSAQHALLRRLRDCLRAL
ncbi:MAG: VOC family protein [Streptosporangiaceae bacterium]